MSYPISETLGFYQKALGYLSPAAVSQASKRWGVNSYVALAGRAAARIAC